MLPFDFWQLLTIHVWMVSLPTLEQKRFALRVIPLVLPGHLIFAFATFGWAITPQLHFGTIKIL